MLNLNNIHKTYDKGAPTETTLFSGLSLHIDKKEFLTVVGSNGSGKTTLLNIIAGTVAPDTGIITLSEGIITKMPEHKRAKYFGRVFQDPKLGTCSSMTVAENLAMASNKGKRYGLKLGLHHKDLKSYKQILSVLNMGLEDKLDILVGQLSGGQRQALALLMASITKPELMLLDEHTAALDPRTSENIMKITEDIVCKHGITTIMVTHNLNYAIRYGNRLIMLHEGKVLLDVKGDKKKNLSIKSLVELFNNAQTGALTDSLLFA